jgi:hypothetical protein
MLPGLRTSRAPEGCEEREEGGDLGADAAELASNHVA